MRPSGGTSSELDLGVWCEHLSPTEVETLVSGLARAGLRLHLSVPAGSRPEDYLGLMDECRKQGVELWAWPLLSEREGYWPNASNAALFSARVGELLDGWARAGRLPAGVSFDFEPSLDRLRELLGLVQTRKWRSLWLALRARSGEGMPQALEVFDALIQKVRTLGIGVHAVTTPFVLDDFELGRWSVRRALGLPLREQSYDWVSFMAYRSEYERLIGHLGWSLCRDTARRAVRLLGSRAALDVGVVGDIVFPHVLHGMGRMEEVRAELRAAREGGVRRIQIYWLSGLIGLEDWTLVGQIEPALPLRGEWIGRFKVGLLKRVVRVALGLVFFGRKS